MYQRFRQFLVLIALSLAVSACVTAPAKPDPSHLAVAKRFLHSIGAGELAMTSFRRTVEQEAIDQPGMAELTRRIFADITAEDFEAIATDVYARHLSREHLVELAQFAESQAGQRFFKLSFDSVLSGIPLDTKEAMRQFDANELTEIIRFGQSDAAVELKKQLPAINQEMAEAGKQLGRAKMTEYLTKHPQSLDQKSSI